MRGQTQKEIAHNQSLERVDMAIQPVIAGPALSLPPGSANVGDCHLVDVGATGEWAGHDDALTMLGDGGWIFLEAFEGMTVFERNAGQTLRYSGGAWNADDLRGQVFDQNGDQVVGSRQAAVALPSGGSTKDTQARTAITDLVDRLVAHGLIAP